MLHVHKKCNPQIHGLWWAACQISRFTINSPSLLLRSKMDVHNLVTDMSCFTYLSNVSQNKATKQSAVEWQLVPQRIRLGKRGRALSATWQGFVARFPTMGEVLVFHLPRKLSDIHMNKGTTMLGSHLPQLQGTKWEGQTYKMPRDVNIAPFHQRMRVQQTRNESSLNDSISSCFRSALFVYKQTHNHKTLSYEKVTIFYRFQRKMNEIGEKMYQGQNPKTRSHQVILEIPPKSFKWSLPPKSPSHLCFGKKAPK